MTDPAPMGFNTYCLRALKWNDAQLLDYAASLKLDAIFLQDSLDPQAMEPAHWKAVRAQAAQLELHLETGAGGVLPRSPTDFAASVKTLETAVDRASAMGSPVVRCLLAGDREHLPPGPVAQHIETMIKLLRTVRTRALDAQVRFAIENHKDLLCWETRQVIEGAGKEFVGSYLDTGNPVFVMENPLTTVEVLGPLAVTFHLRDSVIYETPRGVAVQWVPLGEGIIDFARILTRMREIAPPVFVYIKPITGRPPAILPILEPGFWKSWPDVRGGDLAAFLALARSGRPYEGFMVVEDGAPKPVPGAFTAALAAQQKQHMESSIAYAKNTLNLGRRCRDL